MTSKIISSAIKFIALFAFLIIPSLSFSQDGLFRQLMTTSDKMFVVVIVLLIIFTGIILSLVFLDKRLKQLENRVDKK